MINIQSLTLWAWRIAGKDFKTNSNRIESSGMRTKTAGKDEHPTKTLTNCCTHFSVHA